MRIALISASQVPSRTANSIEVMKVCQAFIDLEHDVNLWVPGPQTDVSWDSLRKFYGLRDRFDIHWMRSAKRFKRYDFCLRSVMSARRWGADIYYTWPFQAAAISSRLNLPTILEVHDRPQGRFGPRLFGQYLRGPGAMRILPITKALLQWLEEYYSIPTDPGFVVIAPSGVDLERYENVPDPTRARQELELAEKITVGYTGHLYPGRGLDLMLELARTNPDIQLLWAGGEPAAIERWRTRIQRSGVENLQILGFVPNEQLPLVQAACDILLLPHERRVSASSGGDIAAFTSPMKLFEYMAAGRTVLASDLPVLREVLNEKNAAFAPPGNIDSWNAELRSLVRDEGRRNALAKQAQEDAKKYTWVVRAKKALDGIGKPRG